MCSVPRRRSFKLFSLMAKILLKAFKDSNALAYLASATQPDSIPKLNGLPEVVVTGRANVGKSTFLNALMGRTDLVRTSKKAGRTRSLNFYRVGSEPGSLVLVDSPGYGARGHAAWGMLWNQYIDTRKELRGIFILINGPHGVTDYDRAMLEDLNERLSAHASPSSSEKGVVNRHIPILQPVLTKVDRLLDEEAAERCVREIKEIAPIAESPILTAIGPNPAMTIGVDAARQVICRACAR